MKTFVLIHGAWHGSWCWQYVEQSLQKLGHTTYALDLPGHYKNKANFSSVTLRTYVEYVKNFIEKLNVEVILIGHSMAGVVISQVAEEIPEKIQQLIYICAFVPNYDGSLIDEEKKALEPSVSLEAMIDTQNNKITIGHSQRLQKLFYGMCSVEHVNMALELLQDQPLQPFIDHVSLSDENFGIINKLYVECLQDAAIHIDDQRRMNQKLNCKKVTLNSDHSPFFSSHENLVQLIIDSK